MYIILLVQRHLSSLLLLFFFNFRQPELVNGALIHGIESRVNVIESKLSDIDARTSEEADNALNERELDRFIMSGNKDFVLSCLSITLVLRIHAILNCNK